MTRFILVFLLWGHVLSAKGPEIPLVVFKAKEIDDCAKNGALSELSVISLMDHFIGRRHIDLPMGLMDLKRSNECFRVKELSDGKGVHTGQIFAISYNRRCLKDTLNKDEWHGLYILKETTKGLSEITNLHRVSLSSLGQEKIPTKAIIEESDAQISYAKARITFEDIHFKIISKRTRYYSLLQMAKGKSLHRILMKFGENIKGVKESVIRASNEFQTMRKMFYRLGYASSKLHQSHAVRKDPVNNLIGKSLIHGDYHAQNLFYDEQSGDVTLIDNETFAMSLDRPESGVKDIVDLYLLHTAHTIAHRFAKQLLINTEMGIDDKIWHLLWKELLVGYLQAFDEKAAMFQAYDELVEKFQEGLSNRWVFQHPRHNLTDQRLLKMLGPSMRRFFLRIYLKHDLLDGLRTDLVHRPDF